MNARFDELIRLMSKLPGFGQRSARRSMLHLLQHKDTLMRPLARALEITAEEMLSCTLCGNYDTLSPCHLCTDERRDETLLCIVETVADLWAIERGGNYKGGYHILGGTLSIIDGRSPDDLRVGSLLQRIKDSPIKEIIFALNMTIEGQTTIHYITEQLKPFSITTSRLAQGIPLGGELDFLDDATLELAFKKRQHLIA